MNRFVKLLSILTFLFLAFVIASPKFIKSEKSLANPFPFKLIRSINLENIVDEQKKDFDGRIGIYIKNLKTNEIYKSNESEKFEAGSIYKVWIMGAVFEKIKNRELSEDDNLEADVSDINNLFEIDEEDAELKEGHLQFTISSAIEQMITISHNYASLMLLSKVKSSGVEDFIKRYDMKNSSMSLPITTTTQDMGVFLEKLYKGEVVDSEYSQKMIEVLKRQKINDRIPKYLPEGTLVAHKTGDIGFFENDAGVVFSPKADYIIVVLSETESPSTATEEITQISKEVYEYFNK